MVVALGARERQVPNLPSHSSSWLHSASRIRSSIACVIYDGAQVVAEPFSDTQTARLADRLSGPMRPQRHSNGTSIVFVKNVGSPAAGARFRVGPGRSDRPCVRSPRPTLTQRISRRLILADLRLREPLHPFPSPRAETRSRFCRVDEISQRCTRRRADLSCPFEASPQKGPIPAE